jgi:hypothetical protein
MQRFTDNQGTEWCVLVTDGAIIGLKQNAKLDLATLGMDAGEAIAMRMTQDASVVVVSLLAICTSRRLTLGITQDEFGRRIEQVYPAARDALLDALVDWASNAAVKARIRRAARAIRAEAARPKEEPKPADVKKPVEAKKEPKAEVTAKK